MAPASVRTQVLLAYAAFVLVGVSAGVGGVLLPAQVADYGIDLSTVGLTFVTFSVGFFVAGVTTGPLMARVGTSGALAVAGAGYVVGALATAVRPSFAGLVALQLVAGYGMGVLESVLNAHLAGLQGATTLLNRLHAFFGAGALIGPLLAARLLTSWEWPVVWLVLGVVSVPLLTALAVAYPRCSVVPSTSGPRPASWLHAVLAVAAERAVLLAAVFLTLYVGLEISVGSWAFTYLVEHEGVARYAASATVSGYWLGLTVGRFVISPLASRLGLGVRRMVAACLVGVVAAAALAWASPVVLGSGVGLVLLGFFLGPLFPTAIAVVPRLTAAHRMPDAIGLMNALSVIGGSALPWLAGTLAQTVGLGTLLPYTVLLAAAQAFVWRAVGRRMAPAVAVA
jgi:fucose permease